MNTGGIMLVLGFSSLTFGMLAWRYAQQRRQLKHRLAEARRSLQNLQSAFSRFAPDEVIERIITQGIPETGESCF